MFALIFGTLFGVVELGLAGAAGLFVWQDARRGWPMLRLVGERTEEFTKRFIGRQLDEVTLAERAVERHARSVAQFREALAKVKANADQYRRRATEEDVLACEFSQLIEVALDQGDEKAARAAAIASTNAQHRSELFKRNVHNLEQTGQQLESRLDAVLAEYEGIQTQAQTVRLHSAVAAANQGLYDAISMVDPQTGRTAKGQLSDLRLKAEEKELTSHHLLALVDKGGEAVCDALQLDARVNAEIEKARQHLALRSADTETPLLESEGDHEVDQAIEITSAEVKH